MKRSTIIVILMIAFAPIFMFGKCEPDKNSKSDVVLSEQQELLMSEANRQVGMPGIKNFQERKLMKMILELRDDEKLVCYCYMYNEFNGKLVFIGKCLGYGLPYATQFTSPVKFINDPNGYGEGRQSLVIPQADPNGLYMPASAEATWVMLLDKEGNPHPVYIEPKVIISPFELSL